jgi:hypothetical protein
MGPVDPTTGQDRGWVVIRRRAGPRPIDPSACCDHAGRAWTRHDHKDRRLLSMSAGGYKPRNSELRRR